MPQERYEEGQKVKIVCKTLIYMFHSQSLEVDFDSFLLKSGGLWWDMSATVHSSQCIFSPSSTAIVLHLVLDISAQRNNFIS